MKIHSLALGTGDNVKNLDETSSLLLEQRVRCTDQWVRVPGFRDVAWEPVWFLSELPRNLHEGTRYARTASGPCRPTTTGRWSWGTGP